MHMPEREDSVRSFAEDSNHYACAKDWTSMMKDAMSDSSPHGEKGPTLYVTDDTYTHGRCSACQQCVCNVLDRRYTCASKSHTQLLRSDAVIMQERTQHLTFQI